MENYGYSNILKRSFVDARLVEDFSAYGLTVSSVIDYVSGVQQKLDLRHLPVTKDHGCPGAAQGESANTEELLPEPTCTSHTGASDVGLPVRCERGSVNEYDGTHLMSGTDFFLHRTKQKLNLETCKLQSVCTLRQHTPMEWCKCDLWYQVGFVDVEEQKRRPFNPFVNSFCNRWNLGGDYFSFYNPEFAQTSVYNVSPMSVFETFVYERSNFLGLPSPHPLDFFQADDANDENILVRHFKHQGRRFRQIPEGVETFNMMRDMFQKAIINQQPQGCVCLSLPTSGFKIEPRFVARRSLPDCLKCGGYLPKYEHSQLLLPLTRDCCCRQMTPVVISLDVRYALMLNYCASFQRLSYLDKTNVLRLLGYSAEEMVACGQLGPIRIKQLGDHGGIHEQLYFVFLMNGLNPFVFTQKSLSEFVVLVHSLNKRYICKPYLYSNHLVFYELIASALRLANTINIGKRLMRLEDLECSYEETILQICGKQEFDHGEVWTSRFRTDDTSEVLESGSFFSAAHHATWGSDPWMKVAQIDAQAADLIEKFTTNDVFWGWLCDHLKKIRPELSHVTAAFKYGVVHLFTQYLCLEESTTSHIFARTMFKANMTDDEIWAFDACHALMFLGFQLTLLWKGATDSFDEETLESGLFTKPFLEFFLPHCSKDTLRGMIEDLRLYSLMRTFTMDLFGAIQAILWWIVNFFKKNIMGVKDEYETFMAEVDSLQEVFYLEDGSTTSLKHQLVKDGRLRDKVMAMMTLGTQLKRRLEKTKASKELLKQVNDRVVRLNKIVSGSSATFVGAEGKIKPFTVYLYGEPGSGKSVMLPHLFADICYTLGTPAFDKTRDMYVLTAKNGYHDQYAYQRFAIRNDVLQMRDDQLRTNEIDDLINMADETPYPLDIAQCEGKGQVYFTSPYLFMTSNFDIRTRTQELASYMTEPDALIRRMDLIVEVHKVDYADTQGFDRSKMRFTIQSHRGAKEEYVNWYGLVDAMVSQISKQYGLSLAVNTDVLSQHDKEQLDRIRGRHLGNPLQVDGHPDEDPLPRYVARYSEKNGRHQEERKRVRFSDEAVDKNKVGSSSIVRVDAIREKRLSEKSVPVEGFSFSGVLPQMSAFDLHVDGACGEDCEYCQALQETEQSESEFSDCSSRDQEEVEAGRVFQPARNVCTKLYDVVSNQLSDMVEVVNEWSSLPEPAWWERRVHAWRNWLPNTITQPISRHVTFYDSYAMAVKCGVVAGSLLAGWIAYKGVLKLFFNKEVLQYFGGAHTSGGEAEYPKNKPQRRARRSQPFKRREFEQAGVSEMTGWAAPNGRMVEAAVFKNLCVVSRGDYHVNGLFVHDHILMMPLHIFRDVDSDVIHIVLQGGVTIEICMTELEENEVFIAERNHVVFINVKRWTRLYPQWCSLSRYFVDGTKDNLLSAEWGQMFTFRSSSLSSVGILQRLMVENVAPASGVFRLKGEDGVTHLVEKSVRGRVNTIFGDCGGPWVLDHETGARIVGIHVSSEKSTMTGRATLVTKQMIRCVMDYFVCKQLPIVEEAEEEAAQNGVFDLAEDQWYDCEDLLICDTIGKTDTFVHNPSRTTLAQTVWRGITPVTKVPSRLREFKRDGQMVRPTKVRFQKWIGKTARIPVEKIRAVYPYLSQWYPRPPRNKRRVLTLEEAVFGEQDGVNSSIEQNTSVGWPWKLQGRKRNEFFDIEKRTITEEFREAVDRYMSGEMFDTVVLDTLKDERVKIEKFEKGDTRVFTICDFTLNTALKMLFGDFVHFLQSRCHESPVKIGISPLPSDWTKLYDALVANEGGLIAGDMSGWDHRCHFEVMMGVVDWINEWYDDDYKDIRYELARMTFEPVHLCDGNVYRSRGGMPSGSYLTTPINSLGVLTYIYMFAQDMLGEDLGPDNRLWLVPAVYGDDHVVAVAHHPSINQQTLCAWFKDLGIIYTDEAKRAPQRPYTNINEVAFLKRGFVKHDGYVWGPLPVQNLLEQVQWYRRSATQRKKSQQQLSEEVLDTVLNEFFFHGRDVYNQHKRMLLDYAMEHARLDVSNGAASYEKKWEQFMGEGKPPPITRLSLIPE
nr:MAG: RNA-dependent RNA polymerase [Wenzhou shrew picorna-like virus 3]